MTAERDIDGLVTTWLRAEATTGGASSRVLERTLDQVGGLGQDRSIVSWRLPEGQARRLGLVAAVVATLLALAGVAVFIGSHQPEQTLPAPSRVVPVATPVPAPAGLSADIVDRGRADASIGAVAWTTLSGDATNLPAAPIVATPDGFASLERGIPQTGSRLMTSVDGLDWIEEPLPASVMTGTELVRSGDDYWITSDDARIWRSKDFRDWTEVALGDIRLPAVHGFDLVPSFGTPITVGTTTLFPFGVSGRLALDELLGLSLQPGEILTLRDRYQDHVLGSARDVLRGRQTLPGFDAVGQEVVGSIRLSATGSLVNVFDATRGVLLAWIDTSTLGADATSVADDLNSGESFTYPVESMVMADGVVGEARLPDDAYVVGLDDAFVAIEPDNTILTSIDAVHWTSLGLPTLPSPVHVLGSDLNPMGSRVGDPDGGLAAVITTESDGVQLFEYWTSADGLRWDRIGVLPPGFSNVIPAGPGRYLSLAETVVTSTTTAEWTEVDGLVGFGRLFDDQGGMSLHSVAGDTVFLVEAGMDGRRVLWVMELGPAVEPTTP